MSELRAKEYKRFEDIKHIRDDGGEYWLARELSVELDYTEWRNFSKVLDKARLSCKNSGFDMEDHFVEVNKMVEIGSGTNRCVIDYELSRYACYLVVQNGDPRKEVIAFGQTYFAIQTRRQEVADYFNQLDEDNKRLVVRGNIKQWNQMLAEAARNAGLITNAEYAIFQNAGYKGLYGGLDVDDIHTKKGLKPKEKILDFMGSEELAANLFRITQTESKLKRENIQGAQAAVTTHYTVGKRVRQTIKDLGGTMPENLPVPEKGISQVEREQIAALKRKAKKKPLMLDE
ncbi:MAG: DNA damage-inducible protein D [Lachnospiraceae bacterium]|jgi:DNA-damage-inducible protein D|nr:DNA damage-inducible protein D [Lachnospiraceae bacterium]